MAAEEVYSPTTVPNPNAVCCLVPSQYLDRVRFIVKVLEVLLSLVAFILEEVVSVCINCTALEFFEFVSCTSFLFTTLLLILLSTTLHRRVGITCWSSLDFVYTFVIAIFFFIASTAFAAINGGTSLEKSAVAFGFLASFAFMVDLFLFWRTYQLPFGKGKKARPTNGIPPAESDQEAQAETTKLNKDATAVE
ncbi:CKLF-like MARVEL transmembrane domain-containing protein 6 [Syngnathus acus]|uniref:CKLF-like MARVEL transmembrane domain-containing protein 6 n=1 Tax=Syngnathus acus TaxID=161584 RepID=UPI001885F4BA|nr:CKLF-like MARVEL transmembrane domain-containing protein 6 [Syngnathus acus]XP_037128905.1 CKLF-like MARVEL transmembrane domain-containing protein 6 [Syngnathus acus]